MRELRVVAGTLCVCAGTRATEANIIGANAAAFYRLA
jgi:hypothetical protein